MNSTTILKPPVGQRVRVTSMPGGSGIGAVGTVSDAYVHLTDSQIAVTLEGTTPPAHQNGCWVVDGWETIYPEIGDKIIPLADNGNWYGIPEEYRNVVGTVVEIEERPVSEKRYIVAEFPSYQKPDDTERWSFYWCKPADGHTLTVSSDDGVRAAAQEEIDTLRRELARANERVEELQSRACKWERDFNCYAERILQEAIDRDWCSQYEEVMDDIRSNLEIATLPERNVEVDISWDETYTITVRRHGTASLPHNYDGDDIDDAARSLNDNSDASREEILDAVRNGAYSSDDYVDGSADTY